MTKIVAVGECMMELSRGVAGGDSWRLRYGGDTLNVATYLARLGEQVAYLTALGEDAFSRSMRSNWAADGIDTSLVLTHLDRLPGLYLIETDPNGERTFHYWRDRSAARALFSCGGAAAAIDRAGKADLLYLSGITLSLFDADGQRRLRQICESVRSNGGRIAFDPNYRPRGWQSPTVARSAIAAIAPLVSIALPTFNDEALLHGDASPERCWSRWQAAGVGEIVIKLGAQGVLVSDGGPLAKVAATPNAAPRDTTGAGDSFNAAYLSARLRGHDVSAAGAMGNALAAAVVKQPGAIIPRATMPLAMKRQVTEQK